MKIRIYYEDTDAGGITYHANYIKFCERARSEYLFCQNIMPGDGSSYGFVVRHMEVDYYAVSILGDMLTVKSKILSINNSSMELYSNTVVTIWVFFIVVLFYSYCLSKH